MRTSRWTHGSSKWPICWPAEEFLYQLLDREIPREVLDTPFLCDCNGQPAQALTLVNCT